MNRATILLTLVATLMAEPAQAQGTDAEKLYREARALMDRGDYAKACPKLIESQRLEPAGGTLAHLAECHEKSGKLVEALTSWRELLGQLSPKHERVALVREKLKGLEPRVPKLTIKLPVGVRGATVMLDGAKVRKRKLGSPIEVNPGEHVVMVRARDGANREYSVELGEGEKYVLEVEIAPRDRGSTPKPGAPRDEAPVESETNPRRTWGFVSIGIGAAALTGFGITELVLLGKCDSDRTCPGFNPNPAQHASLALFVVGAVGVGVGTVLVVTGKERSPEHATVVRPMVGRRMGALSVTRRF